MFLSSLVARLWPVGNINRCCISVFIIIPPSPFKIERGQDLILKSKKSNWMDPFSFSQVSRQASQSHGFFVRKIILRWNVTLLNKKENLMRNSSVSPFCLFVFFSHASPVFPLWSRPALAGLRFQYFTLTKSLYHLDQVFLLIFYSKNAFLHKAHKTFKKRSLRFFKIIFMSET